MRGHRAIWLIVFVAVLLALVAAGVRESRRSRGAAATPPIEALIEEMRAQLEGDPAVHREETRRSVEAVVAAADRAGIETAEVRLAQALRLLGAGKLEDAVAAYRRCIELRANWSWPWNGLGIALYQLERKDEARDAIARAIELDPDWSRPHNDLAIMLRLEGRLEEAMGPALKALELDPANVATENNYANLLVALGQYEEAETRYRHAIELDPGHPSPRYNLACLYSLTGRTEEALARLREALERDPEFWQEADNDRDLDSLRKQPGYVELVKAYGKP